MADTWQIFGITIIVFIAIISLILIFAYLSRECNNNLDCPENEYCAFNHKCVSLPTTEKESNLPSAIVIGVSIIIAALILRNYKLAKTTKP